MPDVSLYCLKCVITIRYGSCKITIKRKYDEFIIVYTYTCMYIYIYIIYLYIYLYINSCTPPKKMRRETQGKRKERLNYLEHHKLESLSIAANRFKFMPVVFRFQSFSPVFSFSSFSLFFFNVWLPLTFTVFAPFPTPFLLITHTVVNLIHNHTLCTMIRVPRERLAAPIKLYCYSSFPSSFHHRRYTYIL